MQKKILFGLIGNVLLLSVTLVLYTDHFISNGKFELSKNDFYRDLAGMILMLSNVIPTIIFLLKYKKLKVQLDKTKEKALILDSKDIDEHENHKDENLPLKFWGVVSGLIQVILGFLFIYNFIWPNFINIKLSPLLWLSLIPLLLISLGINTIYYLLKKEVNEH